MPQTLTMPTAAEVRTAIATGALDDELPSLREAIRQRLETAYADAVQVGAFVKFRNDTSIRPAYIRGTVWRVVKINQKTANLERGLEEPGVGKFGRHIRAPFTMLEPVG